MEDKEVIEILFKKWELLWNHFKLQHEEIQRRRNFVWIIQSAIFFIWYKSFSVCDIFIALILSILGLLLSFCWFFILIRERKSLFLTEVDLRDTENQIDSLKKEVYLKKFISDREIFSQKGSGEFYFKYAGNINKSAMDDLFNFDNRYINAIFQYLYTMITNEKIRSVKFFLDFLLPFILFILWIIIILYTSYHYSIFIFILLFLIINFLLLSFISFVPKTKN